MSVYGLSRINAATHRPVGGGRLCVLLAATSVARFRPLRIHFEKPGAKIVPHCRGGSYQNPIRAPDSVERPLKSKPLIGHGTKGAAGYVFSDCPRAEYRHTET